MSVPPAAPPTSYDEVPYDSHPYAQTHPSRLHAVATLFGLTPPPVANCRVLELGAAAGGNLIPAAEAFPESWFVGLDLSARQVEDGERLVRHLGLKNVSLRHASIMDVDESYGQFDYIICHGVYSWVAEPVQRKILDIFATMLTPAGVAYVSYNTYPGWHMRGMIRDMMRYHATRFATPQLRTQQARALLDFLATSVRQEGPYSALLKSELEQLRHHADHYLYHEHLEEVNDPLYFHQFAERASAVGLTYLGEARISTMVTGNFGPDVEKALKVLATDQIQTEQYMDFLRNRTFRETLLVNSSQKPDWTINPAALADLHVASGGKAVGPTPPDPTSEAAAQYQTRSGMTLSTTRPLLKAAMRVLGEAWPGTVPFPELAARGLALAGRPVDAADEVTALALGLLNSHIASDLIELHGAPVTVARDVSEKPVASPAARLRAAARDTVPNRRHELVRLSELDRKLLPLLDGTRDRPALVNQLAERALIGELTVHRDGKPLRDPGDIQQALGGALDAALQNFAANALLVG